MIVTFRNFISVDCGEPPENDFATITYNSTAVGGVAFYQCDHGAYNVSIKCQADGTWEEHVSMCKGKVYFIDEYASM